MLAFVSCHSLLSFHTLRDIFKNCHDVNVSLLNDLVFLPVKVFCIVGTVGRYAINKSNRLCNL